MTKYTNTISLHSQLFPSVRGDLLIDNVLHVGYHLVTHHRLDGNNVINHVCERIQINDEIPPPREDISSNVRYDTSFTD
ncbi:hypothetical protein DPMN_017388 [Dreissena polymorpha]|uniref:Uncharacterized protein n=1 Tax=Dreissena polymorpha TaxID=45954 RepID=A0A9D4NGD9_DREPO|nr:hypothetical protein DPMN_017388 [Dreissena polymorpha]